MNQVQFSARIQNHEFACLIHQINYDDQTVIVDLGQRRIHKIPITDLYITQTDVSPDKFNTNGEMALHL